MSKRRGRVAGEEPGRDARDARVPPWLAALRSCGRCQRAGMRRAGSLAPFSILWFGAPAGRAARLPPGRPPCAAQTIAARRCATKRLHVRASPQIRGCALLSAMRRASDRRRAILHRMRRESRRIRCSAVTRGGGPGGRRRRYRAACAHRDCAPRDAGSSNPGDSARNRAVRVCFLRDPRSRCRGRDLNHAAIAGT